MGHSAPVHLVSTYDSTFGDPSGSVHQQAAGLIAAGIRPDDVSGALMSEGISLLIATEGKAATIDYLVDLAARISAEN